MAQGAKNNQYTMQDPTKQYPKPPFKKQLQPEPGLAQNMAPKPDHGEETYQGSSRLEGQPPEKIPNFGETTPLGRPGQPAEVAPAYVFFASQESSYITAEILGVTGGQHLP